jgi:hypothetical protein
MNKQGPFSRNKLQDNWLSRRKLIRGAAGAALGAGLLRPELAVAVLSGIGGHFPVKNQVSTVGGVR